jgi:hypothetical protein
MPGIGLKLHRLVLLAVSVIALLQTPAYAQLTIEITGAGANRIPWQSPISVVILARHAR